MKKQLTIFIALCITFFLMTMPKGPVVCTETGGSGISLWRKAGQYVIAHKAVFPSRYCENEIIYDRDGNVQETSVSSIVIQRDNTNSSLRLIRCIKDGKALNQSDFVTLQRELSKHTVDDLYPRELNPFDPLEIDRVTVHNTGKTEKINGHTCSILTYTQRTDDNVWRGTAWIRLNDGVPQKITCSPRTMPKAEDNVSIKKITMTVLYAAVYGEKYGPLKTITASSFIYNPMSFVSFRGKAKSVITYSSYKR